LIVRLAQSPNWYARFNMCDPRRWPTPWAFGLLVLPLGMYVGFAGTALPFLLSKAGVTVDEIARIDALLALPPALMFLWTPVVDVKLRRRTWLVLGASATAFCLSAANYRVSGQTEIRKRRAIEPATDIRLDDQFEQSNV
jgi:hypothetical protein